MIHQFLLIIICNSISPCKDYSELIIFRYLVEQQSKEHILVLNGFPILLSVIQILMLKYVFKFETPKFYVIKNDALSANVVVHKINEKTSIQNDSISERFTFDPSEYDWNKDGRTFESLKFSKYRRSFL